MGPYSSGFYSSDTPRIYCHSDSKVRLLYITVASPPFSFPSFFFFFPLFLFLALVLGAAPGEIVTSI